MEGGRKFSGGRYTVSRTLTAVIILQLLFCGFFTKTGHPSTPNVAVGSSVYEDIEFLSAVGLLDTAMIGALPLSREEVASLIVEAQVKAGVRKSLTKRERRVIRRLEEDFAEDIEDLKTGNDTIYLKPVREAGLAYLYFDQSDSVLAGPGTEVPQRGSIDGRQKSFTYNLDGLEYRKYNAAAHFVLDGRVKLFSFLFEPHVRYRSDPPEDHIVILHRGYVKFGSKVEIELGQDSRWWGQGRHGSLLLSNNAEPLLMVSLRNAKPFILPVLGLVRFDAFLAQLEKERDFKRPELLGLRISFKPRPWLEFGLHRTAMFGGTGRPGLNFGDFLKILFGGKTDTGEGDLANQIVGVDVRVHILSLKTDLYYERGMEDFREFYPYKHAYIVGAYMADLLGFSLRAEFFDSTEYPGVWYRHETYTSGYTFKKRVVGHHAGGDAEDFFVEVGREINDHIKISGSFDLETRGTNQLLIERHRQYAGKARVRFYPYQAEIVGGWEKVDNPGFNAGKDKNAYGMITFKRAF